MRVFETRQHAAFAPEAGLADRARHVAVEHFDRGGAREAAVTALRNDAAKEEIKIDVVSSTECLAHYTSDEEPFAAEASDNLAYAGYDPGGKCGDWIGGAWDGLHGREQEYRIEVDGGVVELGGGHGCAGYGHWIRT